MSIFNFLRNTQLPEDSTFGVYKIEFRLEDFNPQTLENNSPNLVDSIIWKNNNRDLIKVFPPSEFRTYESQSYTTHLGLIPKKYIPFITNYLLNKNRFIDKAIVNKRTGWISLTLVHEDPLVTNEREKASIEENLRRKQALEERASRRKESLKNPLSLKKPYEFSFSFVIGEQVRNDVLLQVELSFRKKEEYEEGRYIFDLKLGKLTLTSTTRGRGNKQIVNAHLAGDKIIIRDIHVKSNKLIYEDKSAKYWQIEMKLTISTEQLDKN